MVDIIAPVTDYPPASLLTTQGDLYKRDATGVARYPVGTANQVIKVNAAGDDLEYVNRGTILNAKGDLMTHDGVDAVRKPVGSANQVIQVNAAGDDLEFVNRGNILTDPGDLMTRDGSDAVRLPLGNANQVIKVNAVGNALEYVNRGSLLTTKGDLMKHNGSVAARLPVGAAYHVMQVNSAGDDLIFWSLNYITFVNFFRVRNITSVTVTSSQTDLISQDLGTLSVNDRIYINSKFEMNKGSTAGRYEYVVLKDTGTATIQSFYDDVELKLKGWNVANDEHMCIIKGIFKVTGAGTLTLRCVALSTGSNGVCPANGAAMNIHILKT